MRCFLDATNQRKQEANRVEMPRKLLLALRHVPRLRSVPQAHGTRSLRGATLRYDSIRVQYKLLMRERERLWTTADVNAHLLTYSRINISTLVYLGR